MAAGKGTRNNSIKGLHKALLPLENKAIISHIFNKLPKNIEIVLAVGYKSEQIKTYVSLVHSDRKITYVDIENYDGEGSGPGLSLLSCEKHLQCPFIFTSVDTLVEEEFGLHRVDSNWIGFSDVKRSESSKYCLVEGEEYLNKFYYGYGDKAFIGMAGIFDYEIFWKNLKIKSLIKNEYQVLNGFTELKNIELKYFNWYDTGNDKSYSDTKHKFCNDIVAAKTDECIFIENGYVIKYFNDIEKINSRVERSKFLNGSLPHINRLNDNMFYYKFINGQTIASIHDTDILKKLIPYWYEKLGSQTYNKDKNFLDNCKIIYHDKTYDRCKYFENSSIDDIQYINGLKVDKIKIMLDKVNWNSIYENAIPSKIHGDFQPENIIYGNDRFTLIDWRESFGNSLEIGDFYYDLGKLYHALLINGKDVINRMYTTEFVQDKAFVFNYTRSNLLYILDELKMFCKTNDHSWENIELLGALQYLGIASLYKDFQDGNYSKFLFLYGKYLLQKFIK